MRSFALEAHFLPAPATPNCGLILRRREHVLVGVSLFNSRFSDTYIEKLLVWAKQNFHRFDIMLPGEADAAWLLESAGDPPEGAARKARHALGRKMKSLHSALHVAGVKQGEARIFRFSDFREDPLYCSLRDQAEQLFLREEGFRELCSRVSRQAIAGRLNGLSKDCADISDAQVRIAVNYIFAEIPFFLDTPALLKVPESLVACHRPWPVAEALFSGRLALTASANQGVVVLSMPAATPTWAAWSEPEP